MPSYVLEESELRPGDVIMTRSESSESRTIRKANSSQFSHALLYVGQASCIESDGLGVRSQNLRRVLVDDPASVAVYRVTEVLEANIEKAIAFARRAVGTEYGTSEARRARRPTADEAAEPNRQFCTRIVAQAYRAAGAPLSTNVDYCGPADLEQSARLERVYVTVRALSDEEAKLAQEFSILDRQLDVQNEILERSRGVLGADIQTLEQLVQAVIDAPIHDDEIAVIIEGSGYLELGDAVVESRPYLYDYARFVMDVPNEKKDEVADLLLREPTTRAHQEQTLAVLRDAVAQTGLRVPSIFAGVYQRQVLLSQIRESVGQMHRSLGLKRP